MSGQPIPSAPAIVAETESAKVLQK
jgi:hypothetical protein